MAKSASGGTDPEIQAGQDKESKKLDRFTLLSEVENERVEWLWRGRIPLGELTILDGDPGSSKSSFLLDLAARVSKGRDMPDGTPGIDGGVILLQAEDSLTKTVRQRAENADADLSRIGAFTEDDIRIPENIPEIERKVRKLAAKLIIVDPLFCFIDANANKDQAIRRALNPLRRLAEQHSLAVVLVRHLTKGGGKDPLYRGVGSIAVAATARSALLMATSPDDEHLRVLAHLKCNLGPMAPSLTFEPVETSDGVSIEWRGQCDHTAEELLAPRRGARRAKDAACELLLEILARGPIPAIEIENLARSRNISRRTLERAKSELDIDSKREGFGPGSFVRWALPPNSRQ